MKADQEGDEGCHIPAKNRPEKDLEQNSNMHWYHVENFNFIHTNIEITTGIYLQLYEIILGSYQISLATIVRDYTAYILACIFTAIIQLGNNY